MRRRRQDLSRQDRAGRSPARHRLHLQRRRLCLPAGTLGLRQVHPSADDSWPRDPDQVAVAGRELDGPSPDAAIVFQDHGLFPWMTVTRNVEFNMKARGVSAAERAKRARGFIAMTSLMGFEDRYPHELSGGMRQRVGIARAL